MKKRHFLLIGAIAMFIITTSLISMISYHFYIHQYSFNPGQITILTMMGIMGYVGSWLYYDTYRYNSRRA